METRNPPFYNKEDRISNLPESLIHHILSFFDMASVVQTCILSRRWRNLWKSVPTLNFQYFVRRPDTFVDFVNRVLLLHDSSNIQRFHLVCYDRNCSIESNLNTWIFDAVKRKDQELSFEGYLNGVRFPRCLFTCESLTKLELTMDSSFQYALILPNSIGLPRLKYLKIDSILIDENITDKFFSSCPVLESLILTDCHMNINISSFTLKHFELVYRCCNLVDSEVKTVKLNAPNLTYFSCKTYMSHDYSLENLSSLVTADIDMLVFEMPRRFSELPEGVKDLFAENMMKVLRSLHNVKDLTLSPWCIEVVSRALEVFDNHPPQFCNLRGLKLQTWLSIDCMRAITYLLKISPNIESLSLEITQKCSGDPPMYPFCDEIKLNLTNAGDCWEESALSLPCMLHHLKFVETRGVLGCVNELKFLQILLKKSLVLEEVVVFSSQHLHLREKRMRKFIEKLRTFRRASSSITILS